MIFYSIKNKGLFGWIKELISTPFGIKPLWAAPLLAIFNLLFNTISMCPNRFRTRCGYTATCTQARSFSY